MKKTFIYLGIIVVISAAFICGYLLNSPEESHSKHDGAAESIKADAQVWYCPMHPQIRTKEEGKCPICHMDLVPLQKSESSNSALSLSPREIKLAEVSTSTVQRRFVSVEVDLIGKIVYDETRIARISAHFPGRVEQLYLNYIGVPVKKGEHIAELFSPDLSVLQHELIMAHRQFKQDKSKNSEKTLEAVKKKMRVWGLTDKQIKEIINFGKVKQELTIYAPVNGIVVDKSIVEGSYFKAGDKLLTITDLSKLWLILDAYEMDIEWIKYGEEVLFEVEAMPGKAFKGRISFISPKLDEKTRTIKVRVNVDNTEGLLKPGMFARAKIRAKLGSKGKIINDALAGKWISPMHPEVISDAPGKCTVCGMDLVPAESLGFVSSASVKKEAPLIIPASAPLITGKRAIVYIEKSPGNYEGREVTLGKRAGDFYIIKTGLQEGEKVVTNGNFKIDSAMQLMAKPSMMNENSSDGQDKENFPDAFKNELKKLFDIYFKIHYTLSRDDNKTAKEEGRKLKEELEKINDDSLVKKKSIEKWKKYKKELVLTSTELANSDDIKRSRVLFSNLSGIFYSVTKEIGTGGLTLYRQFCPMAFDNKGAFWLQNKEELENPYFGSMMFKCGTLEETISE